MKENFVVNTAWAEQIEKLTDEQAGQLLKAWLQYHSDQTPDIKDPVVDIVFSFNRQYFSENAARYAARVLASQENGKKGGRPKNQLGSSENPENPLGFLGSEEKPKKPDYEYEYESEYVSESVSPDGDKRARARRKKAGEKKEPKVQWAEFVTMTNAEHQKLLDTHGPADTARLIEILDNYKGSTGKKYKDDYRAILSWCVDALNEERAKGKPVRQSTERDRSYQSPEFAQPKEDNAARMRRLIEIMKQGDEGA